MTMGSRQADRPAGAIEPFPVKLGAGVQVSATAAGLRTTLARASGDNQVVEPAIGANGSVAGTVVSVGSRSAPTLSQAAAMRQHLVGASKAEQATEIRATLDRIARLHEASFQPASPRRARAAGVDNQVAILRSHMAQQLQGVSRCSLRRRRKAKHDAAWAAYRQIDQLFQADRKRQATVQAQLDHWWARLQANDRAVVLHALIAAFADNEAAAAPIDVDGDTASVLVYLPPVSLLPERQPSVTEAGNLSLRKMTKAQTAAHYRRLVAGFVLVTAKEAFAVAPGLQEVRIIAVRDSNAEDSAENPMECVASARLARATLTATQHEGPDSVSVLTAIAEDLRLNPRTAGQSWEPLRLDGEPYIRALLASIGRQ